MLLDGKPDYEYSEHIKDNTTMVHSETIFIWGKKKNIYLLKSTWTKPLNPNPSCKTINISIGYMYHKFQVIFY